MSKKWPFKKNLEHLEDIHYAVGIIASQWTIAELQLQVFIWFYLNINARKGLAVTLEMPNATKCHALGSLLYHFEKDKHKKAAIEHALKFFNICRENRNILIHWQLKAIKSPKVTLGSLTRASAKGKVNFSAIYTKIEKIRRVAEEIIILTEYLEALTNFYISEKEGLKPSLPKKPPLPNKFVRNPLRFALDVIYPPESSEE